MAAGLIFAMHGVVSHCQADRFVHRNLLDTEAFAAFLRNRPHKFVDLAASIGGAGDSLTIDDGTGAAREAAILARQHGHAVTLFVNPYHVETGEPYWFSLLNAALDATREQVVTYAGETYWIGGCEGKQKLRSNVKEAIGSLSVESMRREHVGAVAALLRSGDVRLPSFLNVLRIPELRELLALGVRIENHGWTHTDLGQAPREVVLREVNDGHDWLLRRLGIQAGVFAAPFGQALPPPGFCREFGYRWLLLTDRFPCRRIQEGVFNRGDLAARVTTIFQEDCGSLGGQVSTPPIQNPGKHLKVLFLGEEPLRDAPTLTLAAGLKQNHIDSLLGGQAARATGWRFLRLALQVDVILYISYGGPDRRTLASLALAALLGRPIVRRWVGTDVLMCLRSAEARAAACLLDPLVSQNIAAAPHLVQELASVGLKACCIPSPAARCAAVREDQEVPKALLVYLPSSRLDFFGEALVRRAVEVNPDVAFVVVGDDTHALAGCSNVRSLGWVDDMGPVLARVGGLLRLTEHDGMPRMVLDCLLRGKYVIFAWPCPGCWLARNEEEVQQRIDEFRRVWLINREGIAAAESILTPDPGLRLAEALRAVTRQAQRARRLRAGLTLAGLLARSKWRRFFRKGPSAGMSGTRP